MDWVGRNLCEFLYYQLLGTTRISSLEFGGQVPHHHEPSFRPHARSVAQFSVHERFVALGSHYPHLRTRLGFSPLALVRHSGQHTHAKTTTCKLLFANVVDSGSL